MSLVKIAVNLHQIGMKTAARKLFRIAYGYEEGFTFDTITEQIYKELANIPTFISKLRKAILGMNVNKIIKDETLLDSLTELASLGSQIDMLPDNELETLFEALMKNVRITKQFINKTGEIIHDLADNLEPMIHQLEVLQEHELALKMDKIYRGLFAFGQRLLQA